MKKISLLSFLVILLACADDRKDVDTILNSEDITAILKKRDEINEKQRLLKSDLDKINQYLETIERKESAALVTVDIVKDTVFKHYIEVRGNVETDQNILLNAEFSGILTDIFVKEGQQVSKGQQLAKIDDGGLSSQLALQETQLALAKTTFERQQRLWEQKIGSEIQFIEAQATYEAALNANKQLRSQLAKTTILAPFSGVIDDILADPGQVVLPGQTPVFRLVNLNNMYIKASIPETYLKDIKPGVGVLVYLDALGEEIEGVIHQVGNYINPNNRSFDVRIRLPNKDHLLRPNLIATVKVNDYQVEKAITIPENILQKNAAGQSFISLYRPDSDSTGKAERRIIETGRSYSGMTEVISGLRAGDTIIMEGSRNLRENQKVSFTTE